MFSRRIILKNWRTGEVVLHPTLDIEFMYRLMAISKRWDDQHATADVRTLPLGESRLLGITTETPVIFEEVA